MKAYTWFTWCFLWAMHIPCASSFSVPLRHTRRLSKAEPKTAQFLFESKSSFYRRLEKPDEDGDDDDASSGSDAAVSEGPNWIERSFPVSATDEEFKPSTLIDYNLGISGRSYQTGPLAQRMYHAMMDRAGLGPSRGGGDDETLAELQQTFKLLAVDCAAKEAVRAALLENGLEMVIRDEDQDVGEWGMVDSIRLLPSVDCDEETEGRIYDDWEEAVDNWTPGQGFDFVVRQVPAKMRALSLDELLKALDPKGELREEAKAAGMTMPDEYPESLEELAKENRRRVNAAPREAVSDDDVFSGDQDKRGYRPIHASDLASLNENGTLVYSVYMHAMDALVSHGCLIVDLTDGGKNFDKAKVVGEMWTAIEYFYELVDKQSLPDDLSGMKTAEGVGSAHAKVGFESYDDGNIQFLETRIARNGMMHPSSIEPLLGQTKCQSLKGAFNCITSIAKDLTRVVIAACGQEIASIDGALAVNGAILLVNELVDDGTPPDQFDDEDRLCMSPHRLCRYSNRPRSQNSADQVKAREVFGAHTDSTFVTAVPVSRVPGLEVFDELAGEWYRPEKAARLFWENEQNELGKDPSLTSETLEDGTVVPWHARYVVMMPGELLQIFARSEVLAAVHRVVARRDQSPRLSAPVLVRGRPDAVIDAQKYVGGSLGDPIIEECEKMKIKDVYDWLQAPAAFQ